jgi:hypothetical protein
MGRMEPNPTPSSDRIVLDSPPQQIDEESIDSSITSDRTDTKDSRSIEMGALTSMTASGRAGTISRADNSIVDKISVDTASVKDSPRSLLSGGYLFMLFAMFFMVGVVVGAVLMYYYLSLNTGATTSGRSCPARCPTRT